MEGTNLFDLPLKAQAPPVPYQALPLPPPSSSDTSFPILAISLLGILTTVVLLVSYYVFVIKCCLHWRHSDVIGSLSDPRYFRRQSWRDEDPFATAAGRRGLEEAVIRAMPVFPFKKDGGGDEGCEDGKAGVFRECAVCLNEFVEGERLRRLPGCSHAFHIDCIDVWLQSSANCPLCRSGITGVAVLETGQALVRGPGHHSGAAVMDVRDDGSDGAVDVTPRAEASMQQHQLQQEEEAPAMPAAQQQPSPRKAEQRTMRDKERGRFHHACSMGDECIDVRSGKDEQFCVQRIRRSFSVDDSSDRWLYLSVQENLQCDPRLHSQETLSAGEGRSSGSSGSSSVPPGGRVRRSFFSFGWGSRSVVLPTAIEP